MSSQYLRRTEASGVTRAYSSKVSGASMSDEFRVDRFTWEAGDIVWLDNALNQGHEGLELGQFKPGEEEEEEKTQEPADEGSDDTIETEGGIAPERMDRFITQSSYIIWLDKYLHPLQHPEEYEDGLELGPAEESTEESEEEDEADICQGPFWPSPDDPDTGYCTCCEQAYYGDLLNHSSLSDDDGEMEDDDEDAEERPVLKL